LKVFLELVQHHDERTAQLSSTVAKLLHQGVRGGAVAAPGALHQGFRSGSQALDRVLLPGAKDQQVAVRFAVQSAFSLGLIAERVGEPGVEK